MDFAPVDKQVQGKSVNYVFRGVLTQKQTYFDNRQNGLVLLYEDSLKLLQMEEVEWDC